MKRGYRRPLFRATRLGDKYPTVDLLVDALGPNDVPLGFFFAQVKGTGSAPTPGVRLPVEISLDRFNRLARLPAPAYLIGVDVSGESAYPVAAHRPRKAALSSITRAYPLDDDTVKIRLYREVLTFWRSNRPARLRTEFSDV